MKLFILTALLFSFNSFAGRIGYNCVAANPNEDAKLAKVGNQLGGHYLAAIRVLSVEANDCADATVGQYSDQCRVGAFDLNIGYKSNATLVRGALKIKLICEEDRRVEGQPAGGGSN